MRKDNAVGRGSEVAPPIWVEKFLSRDEAGSGWYRDWSKAQYIYLWQRLGDGMWTLSVGTDPEGECVVATIVEVME